MPQGFTSGFPGGGQSFVFTSGFPGGGPHQFRDPNEVFASVFGSGGIENIFGGMSMGGSPMGGMGGMGGVPGMNMNMGGMPHRPSRPSATKPQTTRHSLDLSLEELANGCTKKLKVTHQGVAEVLTVNVKPGWKVGTKITFNCRGSNKVQFVVKQKPHKYLKRENNDLHWECNLSASQATSGAKLTLSTPIRGDNGRLEKVQLCTKDRNLRDGNTMTISGKGMPIKGGPARGDMVITFRIPQRANAAASA